MRDVLAGRAFVMSVALVALCVRGAFADETIAFTGRVVSADGRTGLEGVAVTVYRQKSATQGKTSKHGDFRVELPAGSFVDYVVFEHDSVIPKVIPGPFSGSVGSTFNVVMQSASTKGMSLPATLTAIQSIQFLNLVLDRSVRLPPTLVIEPKLKVPAEAVASSAEDHAGSHGGGRGSDRVRPKAMQHWPMDDPFFNGLTSKP